MIEFFEVMLGLLDAVGTFIQGAISTLFLAIDALEVLIALPLALIGILPTILATALTLVLLLYIIKFCLGR